MPFRIDTDNDGNLLTIRNAVPYTEVGETVQRFTSDGQLEIKRFVQVRHDRKEQFISDVLADAFVEPYPSPDPVISRMEVIEVDDFNRPANDARSIHLYNRYYLNRLDPEPHPRVPGLFAQEGEIIEGLGYPTRNPIIPRQDVGNDLAFGQQASDNPGFVKIAITYRSLPYDIDVPRGIVSELTRRDGSPLQAADFATNNSLCNATSEIYRYVSRKRAPAGENQPLPNLAGNGLFRFALDGDFVNNNSVTRPIHKIALTYTWHMVPVIPTTVYSQLGRVNDRPFDILNGIFRLPGGNRTSLPTTRVRYDAVEISPSYVRFNSTRRFVDITFHLLVRVNVGGHLSFLRARPATNPITIAMLSSGGGDTFITSVRTTKWFYDRMLIPSSGQVIPFADRGPQEHPNIARGVFEFGDLENIFRIDI